MDRDPERFVPKVHPASRGVGPDDPFDLNATLAPGDLDLMFRSVVQEFAWLGWSAESIFGLFGDPFYPMLNGVLKALGDVEVRLRIDAMLAKTGIVHFHARVVEAEPDETVLEPELVPIGVPTVFQGRQDPSPGSFVSLESLRQRVQRREGDGHVEGP